MKNRVKKQALSFATVMAMILGGGMQLYAADKIADTVYRNGKIYTITETVQEATVDLNIPIFKEEGRLYIEDLIQPVEF